ncbi:glycosyltransferase [Tropicimonas sediminicola]|uniref:Glycosyltransferase involved in cell wall bisynthesis n=1 Tax=Tropicimonas sediminicola TaxID=1031541 RepID=A0A239H8Y8_9RHOB|nr:glycosyltransferase [Tropicimonas sediminicola]SNS77827.1 Glycosyltransferase involved in cell wall bisynthesis [Tropicimonas sediminicola]
MDDRPQSKALPRLAYLTSEYPAVSHTFILREVLALRRLGFEVETCSIRRTDPALHHLGPQERQAAASTFYVLGAARSPLALISAQLTALARPARWLRAAALAWRSRPPGLRAMLYQAFYLVEAAVLARHLRQRGITHLHCHFGHSACSVAMLASELSGIPYSFTLHGPTIFYAPKHWRIDEKIARARFVACISRFCRSQAMIFAAPEHWDRLKVIHCGVDPALYDTGARERTGKRLLFVGRLAAVKGVPVLLEAFKAVAAQHPEAHLTLIGDGPERARLETEAEHLGVSRQVAFAGYRSQEEVAAALADADLFVLPSFAEGVPVVLMEAMAARLPVVATRVGGVQELVEDGVSGLAVTSGDADAFADALLRLLDDPDRMRSMGEAGRAQVIDEFSTEREAERLAGLFRGDMAGPARQ